MEMENKRMEWQAEQVQKDDEQEVRFMTFMKDVFSMFAPPPPVPLLLPSYTANVSIFTSADIYSAR